MAAASKVKVLWSVFMCLIFLVLYMNLAGPMWPDQLDMAISAPFKKQRHNSSDAVLGRSSRHVEVLTAVEKLSPAEPRHVTIHYNGTSSSYREQHDICTRPVTNLVFIKVHKTASASTAVVLLRFAYKHHMTMCYSPRGNKRFTLTFPSTEIYKSNCSRWQVLGDHFNFLVHHTVFNKTAMDRIMKPGTKYIGIMREPQSHFRSQFFYRRHHLRYRLRHHPNPLGAFLDNPEHQERKWSKNRTWSGERNNQAFIMGFPPHLLNTQDTGLMDDVIKQLGQSYTFVIINEYYEESLVMLRRKLCWDMSDILHSTKKIHEQHNPKKYIPLTDKQLENHKRINAVDYRMYDFFNRTFWESVEEEAGRGFWEEVTYFRYLVERVNKYCLASQDSEPLNVPISKWNNAFSVNEMFCKGLNRKPKDWAKKLFYQMTRRDKIWKKPSLNVASK
ncbi:galactose-3-O-sulfotransferase 2-like [Branchiostoma floridae]|uniref:Galactose-3-O-sulfotransferase 2-like n=1 Tax=Branchiostoma floridae TaxID=7739 RepID=A0A9J7M9W4_BRAFL|nr:galactose-3-O-sulfotransferase 2-like [Branchiostoma floridae]